MSASALAARLRRVAAAAAGLEPMARKMLAEDPALKAAFDKRLREDKAFAADPQARLQWFYQRTPFHDVNAFVYPVGLVF